MPQTSIRSETELGTVAERIRRLLKGSSNTITIEGISVRLDRSTKGCTVKVGEKEIPCGALSARDEDVAALADKVRAEVRVQRVTANLVAFRQIEFPVGKTMLERRYDVDGHSLVLSREPQKQVQACVNSGPRLGVPSGITNGRLRGVVEKICSHMS
ncbi:MAG: hypothetical protein KDD64_15175 [Bdellovibrionales bacterium]|nr:hypothetical protein [Bdellovibrionales bacterium]